MGAVFRSETYVYGQKVRQGISTHSKHLLTITDLFYDHSRIISLTH